ncbi:MAG: hypothetical protein ABH952_05040 [Candidatus Omnitrophota bacterium]
MKKIFLLILIAIFLAGCATMPYVYLRSDVFADSKTVSSIYIMPVVIEVKVDSQFSIKQNKLQDYLYKKENMINEFVALEFEKRGYKIVRQNKKYRELDLDNQNDKIVKLALQEFLASPTKTYSDDLDVFLKTIIAGERILTDKAGNEKKVDFKKVMEQEEKKGDEPLVKQTLKMKDVIPEFIDTVLYIEIESFIANRGLFNRLQEKSTATVKMKLVSLKEEKVIFSYGEERHKRDIFHGKSFRNVLIDMLEKIPIKIK